MPTQECDLPQVHLWDLMLESPGTRTHRTFSGGLSLGFQKLVQDYHIRKVFVVAFSKASLLRTRHQIRTLSCQPNYYYEELFHRLTRRKQTFSL